MPNGSRRLADREARILAVRCCEDRLETVRSLKPTHRIVEPTAI
jgi:hypothetical protein